MAFNNGFPTTTSAQGMFNGPSSKGFIVGHAHPDPATRFSLRGGIVASDETLPMYGGVAVYQNVPSRSLGVPLPTIGRATGTTGAKALTGFTVVDQSFNLVIDPGNNVPAAGSGQTIGYYSLGSRARIAVAADPVLIDLAGEPLNSGVSWDFTNQLLVAATAAHGGAVISDAVWNNTNGGEVVFTVGTDLSAELTPGTSISVTGVANTGGASTSAFNGEWDVVSSTANSVTVLAPADASIGTYAAGGAIAAGGGDIPVTVLDILPTGCMVPEYNSVTGALSWNYSGCAAIIQLTGGTVA